MSKSTKLSIFLLIGILLASLGFAAYLVTEKQKLEQSNSQLSLELQQAQDREKQKIVQVQKLEADLTKQIEKAKDEREQLTKKVKEAEGQVDKLVTQTQEAKQERDQWKGRIDSVRSERDALDKKVAELNTQLEEAQKSVQQAKTDLAKAQEEALKIANTPVAVTQASGAVVMRTPTPVVQPSVSTEPAKAPTKVEPPENETYWAQVLREKTELEIDLRKLKNELSTQSIEIVDLEQQNVDLQISLENFQKQKTQIEESLNGKYTNLNKELRYKEDMINSLSLEVAKARSDRSKFETKVDDLQKDNGVLRGQVQELSSTKSALEKTIVRLKDDKSKVEHMLGVKEALVETKIREIWEIKQRLDKSLSFVRSNLDESFSSVKSNLESSFKSVETDLKSSIHSVQNNLDQSFVDVKTNIDSSFDGVKKYSTPKVELPPIVVNSNLSANAIEQVETAGLNGKVISINTQNNFLIMDVGQDKNINIGNTYSVYRGATYIGSVEIIQVRKEISAADIKEQRSPIQVGDIVR